MRIRKFLTGATALALLASPTLASAAPAAAPASARASAPEGDSKFAGGGDIFAVLALAAIIVGAIVIGESNDNDSPRSP